MKIEDIQLTPEFKNQTTRAIVAIIFFVLTYLVILALATGLTVACMYGGLMMITAAPHFITIVLGLGLASMGILVLIFLLKFMFKFHKVDRSHLHEIKRKDEPALFSMIDEIVEKVDTSFPKKVYLSSNVNAAVFYDSSFWSMFFPIRKNLQIGLGLVNTVSKSELKAILSHEFGHFSQKTMKVGSYVYNVNQVIFNMLYDNESYERLIQRWGSISDYITIFVLIAIKIIEFIQWILRGLYNIVNKSYMALSREMEFHADEIAAHVTGFEPLKTSLLRLSLADHALNQVFSFYEGKMKENLVSDNVYKEHSFVLNYLANYNEIPIENNLPAVSLEALNKFNKSKLIIKNQWASHPSVADRIERLEQGNIQIINDGDAPANTVFKNIENLQKLFSDRIFKQVEYTDKTSAIPFEEFKVGYENDFLNNSFPEIYNGYYDDKNPRFFELKTAKPSEDDTSFETLFSDKNVDLVYTARSLEKDIITLEQITSKAIAVKTFDYDGQKYQRKESRKLTERLKKELADINQQITANDLKIFELCLKQEKVQYKIPQLEHLYATIFELDKEWETKYGLYRRLEGNLQFINYSLSIEEIESNFYQIRPLETQLKEGIKAMLDNKTYAEQMTPDIKENFELYLSKKWDYFGRQRYFENNLSILFTALNNYAQMLSKGYFEHKKRLLNYQIELMDNKEE